jgi:hypothetical protein
LPAHAKFGKEKTMRFVEAHFRNLQTASPWKFFFWVFGESFVLSITAAYLASLVLPHGPRTDLPHGSAIKVILLLAIVGPVLETLIFQWAPIQLLCRFRVSTTFQILASIAFFAGAHYFSAGIPTGIAAGLVLGFYLAFSFVTWRKISATAAFGMTAAIHAAHNLVPAVVLLMRHHVF